MGLVLVLLLLLLLNSIILVDYIIDLHWIIQQLIFALHLPWFTLIRSFIIIIWSTIQPMFYRNLLLLLLLHSRIMHYALCKLIHAYLPRILLRNSSKRDKN